MKKFYNLGLGICTVYGHKYFIRFRIHIDLRVFPSLMFNFWGLINEVIVMNLTEPEIKRNKFDNNGYFIHLDTEKNTIGM